MIRVLLVEDDRDLRGTLRDALALEGLDAALDRDPGGAVAATKHRRNSGVDAHHHLGQCAVVNRQRHQHAFGGVHIDGQRQPIAVDGEVGGGQAGALWGARRRLGQALLQSVQ